MKKIYLLLTFACGSLFSMDPELYKHPILHRTVIGDIQSVSTPDMLAFMNTSAGYSIVQKMFPNAFKFPEHCNTYVSPDAQRFLFEIVDPQTNRIKIMFSGRDNFAHYCDIPENINGMNINQSEFLWAARGKNDIFFIVNKTGTDETHLLHMDILSADSMVPEAKFLVKLLETKKSASFRELIEKNPSRRISDKDLEECLELLSKPSVPTFVSEADITIR